MVVNLWATTTVVLEMSPAMCIHVLVWRYLLSVGSCLLWAWTKPPRFSLVEPTTFYFSKMVNWRLCSAVKSTDFEARLSGSQSQVWNAPAVQPCTCACTLCCFSSVQLFATPRTVACQAPLSMGLLRQEYWSGFPCPSPGDLPNPGIEPVSQVSCIGRPVLYH